MAHSINLLRMELRRSVAILSAICALSLTLAPGNSGCGNQHSGIAAAAGEHGGMHTGSQGDREQQKPCKSSTVVCCQAMTSCGLSVQITNTVSTDDALLAENSLPPAPLQVALNRITPPEPPPPKA